MKQYQIYFYGVLLVNLFLASITPVHTQDASVLWINVYGTSPAYAHMTFGNRIGNTTRGVDDSSSFPSEYYEQSTWPPPPGFEAYWAPISPNQFGTGIRGLLDRQFNAWMNETQIDTFRISFYQSDNENQDISFKWPSITFLALRCDSLIMRYYDPNVGFNVDLNMFTTDTLVIPAAGTNGVSFVKIFKYGAKLIDTEVSPEQAEIPTKPSLSQNYPNPFNPMTDVRYQIAERSHVLLKIFDVLGRDIVTLVDEIQDAGYKSVRWEAANVPSGVYFYRVQAGEFVETKKMILMR